MNAENRAIEQQAREILAEIPLPKNDHAFFDPEGESPDILVWNAQSMRCYALAAIARALTRPAPTEAEAEVEYEFQVMQDDCLQASGYAPSPEEAAKEADHYAMLYGQDGPVEVVFYKRIRMARAALGVEGGDDGRG